VTTETWLAVAGIIGTLLVQTAIVSRWSAKLQEIVAQHEREINAVPGGLRESRHQHAQRLTEHEMRLDGLERKEG